MDIYAVGQIAQWLVTGNVHRDTGRRALGTVDGSLSPLDPIIDTMLQDDPRPRPANAREVMNLINRAFERGSLREEGERDRAWMFTVLERFDDALLDSFPGRSGLFKETDPAKIGRLLRNLAAIPEELGNHALWWNRGSSNRQIDHIRELEDGTWLISIQECRIKEVCVNKQPGDLARQYVLIVCEPMPSFGLDEVDYNSATEEAAWFKDRYISRAEYEDRRAEIDGEVVRLHGEAEPRVRARVQDFMFVGSQFNAAIWPGEDMQNDGVVREVYEKLKSSDIVTPSLLEPLMTLDVHSEIRWWS
jgi:serine/threonine-protein kinase